MYVNSAIQLLCLPCVAWTAMAVLVEQDTRIVSKPFEMAMYPAWKERGNPLTE